jgi:hypothetical protein
LGKYSFIQDKNVFRLTIKIGGGTRFEGGGCSWHKATMVSSKGIVGVMGWRVLATRLYSLALPKIKHW